MHMCAHSFDINNTSQKGHYLILSLGHADIVHIHKVTQPHSLTTTHSHTDTQTRHLTTTHTHPPPHTHTHTHSIHTYRLSHIHRHCPLLIKILLQNRATDSTPPLLENRRFKEHQQVGK